MCVCVVLALALLLHVCMIASGWVMEETDKVLTFKEKRNSTTGCRQIIIETASTRLTGYIMMMMMASSMRMKANHQ